MLEVCYRVALLGWSLWWAFAVFPALLLTQLAQWWWVRLSFTSNAGPRRDGASAKAW